MPSYLYCHVCVAVNRCCFESLLWCPHFSLPTAEVSVFLPVSSSFPAFLLEWFRLLWILWSCLQDKPSPNGKVWVQFVAIAITLSSMVLEMSCLPLFVCIVTLEVCTEVTLRGLSFKMPSLIFLSISLSNVFSRKDDRLVGLYDFGVKSLTLPTLAK